MSNLLHSERGGDNKEQRPTLSWGGSETLPSHTPHTQTPLSVEYPSHGRGGVLRTLTKSGTLSHKSCAATNPTRYLRAISHVQILSTLYAQRGSEHPSHPSPGHFLFLEFLFYSYFCLSPTPQNQHNCVAR